MLPVSDFIFEKKEQIDKYGKIKLRVLVVFGFLIISLFGTQLVFATNLVSGGEKLHKINQELSMLESENINLTAQIAQASSLTSLSQKAEQMGFKKPQKVLNP